MRPKPDPVAGLLAWLIIVSSVLYFAAGKARGKLQALQQVRMPGRALNGARHELFVDGVLFMIHKLRLL